MIIIFDFININVELGPDFLTLTINKLLHWKR